ncbi:MAG: gephyrin-like molybdotransferase Glp [Rhizobiaceae bacterium]
MTPQLLSVEDALGRLLDGATALAAEACALGDAAGRVLASPVLARRTQPPFDASAMDGYAVRAADVANLPALLSVVGESAAGRRYAGRVEPGKAVRIFTGAPVPEGADAILLQENVRIVGEGSVEAFAGTTVGRHIRRAGLDFAQGDLLLPAGRLLDAAAIALVAAGDNPAVEAVRRPLVAILATGDELILPGGTPGPDQIVASNTFGIAALASSDGARVLDLGIAPDDVEEIGRRVRHAREAGADILVTVGGASVGDHDLVRPALEREGMTLDFWKIAMRPGKPLMFGRIGPMRVLGLPGNPVSSLVCSQLFLRPLIARLAGRPDPTEAIGAVLGTDMGANDGRQDYVRAVSSTTGGVITATPLPVQDSSMLSALATADLLIVRPPHAAAAARGERCTVLRLR